MPRCETRGLGLLCLRTTACCSLCFVLYCLLFTVRYLILVRNLCPGQPLKSTYYSTRRNCDPSRLFVCLFVRSLVRLLASGQWLHWQAGGRSTSHCHCGRLAEVGALRAIFYVAAKATYIRLLFGKRGVFRP